MNFASHNTGVVIGQLLCFGALIFAHGCESKVTSITTPSTRVNRSELQVEVETFLAIADLRFEDLNKQDQFRDEIFKHATLWAQGGTVNPIGLALSLASIIGIGATVDNVTKRRRENAALRRYTDKVIENDKKVIEAFLKVPRHLFVPQE